MRRSILEKLKKWSNTADRKPLLLYGARQIGKTYSLQEFGREKFRNTIYINFEREEAPHNYFQSSIDPKHIINEIETHQNIHIDPEKDLIIFDEIQECPRAVTSLKYFCEEMPQQAIVAAGSLLGVKLQEVSFPVGKVDLLYMQPMSYEEFLWAYDEIKLTEFWRSIDSKPQISNTAHQRFWEIFKFYLITGGMPDIVKEFLKYKDNLKEAFERVVLMQEALLNIYYADIGKHCGKENSMHIRRILENIPEQLAREQDTSVSKFRFKGVLPRKDKYSELVGSIDWLEAAGLIHRVQILHHIDHPLVAFSKENFFKLYLFDVGVLRALSGLDPSIILDYDFGTYKGYIAENFVLQEFVYGTQGRTKLYSWSEGTAEIEFIRDIGGDIIPVEVKAGMRTKTKSLSSYDKRYQPKYKVIMSGQTLDLSSSLHRYPLYLASKFPLQNFNNKL